MTNHSEAGVTEQRGVTYTSADGVAIVKLDNPQRLNALDPDDVVQLETAWRRLEESDDRCAALIADGRSFCTGVDVRNPPADVLPAIPGVSAPLTKPVVAAVQGHCIGIGWVLAQACDLIVASEDARLVYPETRIGMSGGVGAGVASRIPHKVAMEFLLLGEAFSAARAYEVGMVNRVVPVGEHADAALTLARRIASGAPMVVSMLKRFADASITRSPAEDAAAVTREARRLAESADAKEGIRAIREKRDPEFTGA